MPPKKNANVSISAKTPEATAANPAKVKKKRPATSQVTKAKPLRTPSVIKIKIKGPKTKDIVDQATIGETVSGDKPIKYVRHLQKEHQIELSNQVAQIQLEKPKLIPKKEVNPEAVKKARPRKAKKAVNVKVETVAMDSEVAPPAPTSKKKKPPAKPKAPKAPPKPRVRKPKATESATNKTQPEYTTPKLPKSRARPRGKKKIDASSQEVQLCPDILNELRSFEVSTTPRTSSRSSSTLSVPTDNFSWVKEISSSSTTTPTKDLVCINGKLPEIKLVDYRKSGRRQCKRRLDDVNSISGSSKTSEILNKRMKIAKNTSSMTQKKFRLSLRKKNNNWSVSKPHEENNLNMSRSLETSTEVNATACGNSKEYSSSSSDISHRSNVDLSSSTSSSSSHSTHTTANSLINRPNITKTVLNINNINNRQNIQNIQEVRRKLDSLDLEFINWLGEVDKELNLNKLNSISSDILRLEHDAIIESQHFKLRLSNSSSEKSSERNVPKSNSKGVTDEVVPINAEDVTNNLGNVENILNSQNPNEIIADNLSTDDILATPIPVTTNSDSIGRKSCGETNYINDDDDALSLFAESITGLESSKYSTAEPYKNARSPQCSPLSDEEPNGPDFTEDFSYYNFSSSSESSPNKSREIPKRVIKRYVNSKDIFASPVPTSIETPKMVTCVRKVADSTSVHKDENLFGLNNVPKVNETVQYKNQSKSSMINANYFPTSPVKSQVFRGVCFFNLISKCKCKNLCNFPHQRILNAEIENRLQRLQESTFVSEYMLLRKYPPLRDSYITIFVNECFRRDLTPILLEMVIDCYKEQPNIRTHALETALLNISSKNLDDYAFFLNYNSEIIGDKVCDVLMKAIADTQNFTRFKQVFVKLTDFMVQIGRTFVLDVSGKILERICILPYEESLASAMLKIVRHTSLEIFNNPSMNVFETRLRELNMDIFNKLEECKKAVLVVEATPSKVENISTNIVGSVTGPGLAKPKETQHKRNASPDTTHFETKLKKFDNLLLITRTVDLTNNSKTYVVKPAQNLPSVEEAQQMARKPFSQPPPIRQPLLRPGCFNVKKDTSLVKQKEITKFSLLSQRFGRDAPFW